MDGWDLKSYDDGLEDRGILGEVFQDPGEDAGGGVPGGEDYADDVVGDLFVCQGFGVFHEGCQEIVMEAVFGLSSE